ncbi:hypothetical protein [Cellulomonas palmilytica]|uniref:hypothetical protein n=1 Tax=Cellulomonas palmilytica TaxID=2608402 RepID=UPI001F31BBDC|nr:hypothetical protein [Cellulomonas palmilytica]UJP39316.1 hypothetical protein F1D97_13350 [Cellulomonas palmilytica]
MALPAGITTCTVTKSPPKDILGNAGVVKSATVKADRDLVWSATGETLYGQQEVPVAPVGDGLSFPLIHVNQAGVLDPNTGLAVTYWYYTVKVTVAFGNRTQTDEYRFQPLQNQATLDLDKIQRKGLVLPSVSAPLPAVSSVVGYTGGVTAEQLLAGLGFPVTVTGERASGEALASLLTTLAELGLIVDSTTPGTASTSSRPPVVVANLYDPDTETWLFEDKDAALAAGYDPEKGDTIAFVGLPGGPPPSWMEDLHLWTEGGDEEDGA